MMIHLTINIKKFMIKRGIKKHQYMKITEKMRKFILETN